MTIAPEDCPRDKPITDPKDRLIQLIDNRLKNEDPNKWINIADCTDGLTEQQIEEVLLEYQKVGWETKITNVPSLVTAGEYWTYIGFKSLRHIPVIKKRGGWVYKRDENE
jgi:hypothetical protein